MVNKMVNGKQCTVTWYVDDIKMSHENQQVLEDLLMLLNDEFGKEAPSPLPEEKYMITLGWSLIIQSWARLSSQ